MIEGSGVIGEGGVYRNVSINHVIADNNTSDGSVVNSLF